MYSRYSRWRWPFPLALFPQSQPLLQFPFVLIISSLSVVNMQTTSEFFFASVFDLQPISLNQAKKIVWFKKQQEWQFRKKFVPEKYKAFSILSASMKRMWAKFFLLIRTLCNSPQRSKSSRRISSVHFSGNPPTNIVRHPGGFNLSGGVGAATKVHEKKNKTLSQIVSKLGSY